MNKNRMQGRNMLGEVFCLSAQWGYTLIQYAIVGDHRMTPTEGNEEDTNAHEPIVIITDKENGLMPVIEETTNLVESEHSVLKQWLSTYRGDLDTVFLNIDSVIEGQISEIKKSLEYSGLKEKYNAKSNPILKNISNNIMDLDRGLDQDLVRVLVRDPVREKNVEGDGNCGYRVIAYFVYKDEHQWPEFYTKNKRCTKGVSRMMYKEEKDRSRLQDLLKISDQARCFEYNSTDHLVVDCPKAIEKEKGTLEAKLEAIKKKKKDKGLIGAWDQNSSENEGEEKVNMCFMALESEVQSSPSNFSSFIDDDDDDDDNDDDLNSMLIEMYDELKKISKRNKELKNKIDD
ncbi:hypothetical protein M9H77_34701 [Catharanthus roseus]|uniref:Uncharacterized protein n=1 Tax=Catharanthus roseus TaxID=4058 RepID=A0ACB9ZLY1_CATRO|nr:hypothetical protein M9H77_34701 [Catharanthus roseus]